MDTHELDKLEEYVSLPKAVLEAQRVKLKDKTMVKTMFNQSREITKQNITEYKQAIRTAKNNDESLLAMSQYLACLETLKRIDDFEMIHLNLCDLFELVNKNTTK